jgi:hypothetical protein|tara:strand:+ start:856 stop:1080 length:225 start_codon:yes stop_codon:yes gene_type:complete
MARDYKREYETYHSKPEQKKRRASRNKARRQAIREGRVKKGSKMDIHHKDKNPKNNGKKNLKVVSRSKNRSKKI